MVKKIILLVLILGLLAGGFFYWRNSQTDVRELNKTLPDGVKVVKDWEGNYWLTAKIDGEETKIIKAEKENDQYKIINKRYNYEFILPEDRKGLWRITYSEASGDDGVSYICKLCVEASELYIGLIGGFGDNMTIESYRPKDQNITLDQFTKNGSRIWLYRMDIERVKMGDTDVIIASREYGPEDDRGRLYNYFFRGVSNFYKLEHVSKDFIDYVVLNGKW